MGQKRFDFGFAHLLGMPLVVKQDEAANPLYVGFFGSVGVVFESDDISHLIQQFLRALLHEE